VKYGHAQDAADGLDIFGGVRRAGAIGAAHNEATGGRQDRFDLVRSNRETTADEQPRCDDQLNLVAANEDVLDGAALAIRKRYLIAAADRAPFVRPPGLVYLSSHCSSLLELLPETWCPTTIEPEQQDREFS
jgi:hypothetical protein